ncbi:MAG TPA: succinylglutamate desuccinylase/aspartoacylase family protein [Verrucomicrobiae bacterium]|nr:succinylglutamate desuccinylase/aspartoacylase family protein [Verrucomicrobiae bacterium]
MTRLTPEQVGIVVRELDAMLADGDRDEAWRVMKMFADARFNIRLADFPTALQQQFASLGSERRKSYAALLADVHTLAGAHFNVVRLGEVAGHELVKLESKPPPSPYATRLPICLVAGVHGDEPDGVGAALEFARRFAKSRDLVANYALTIYPCVNPVGYERMTRENGNERDLNREFFRDSREEEVLIMERELGAHEFSGFISGHSDYESFGLYAYATGAVLSERLAKPALFQASHVIPINTDPIIDGHPASYGIINQKFPGSLGPLAKGDTEPFDITIETPNLFSLRKRVEAQAIAFETILHEYRAVASEGMYL